MTNYNEIIDKCRELARDMLRMIKINKIRTRMLSVNNDKDQYLESIKRSEKAIAIHEYNKAKLDPAHPDIENLTKNLDESITSHKSMIENHTKMVEDLDKDIAELNKKIEEVSNGTWKCDMCDLEYQAEKLAKEVIKEEARGIELTR